MEETRIVNATWDVSTFKYRIEGQGLTRMLSGMRDAKLIGIKCSKCGTVYLPGSFYCRKCHIEIDEAIEVGDHGEVMTYTVGYADVRGNPLEEPRVSPMVKFDGCDAWVMGALEGVKPEDVHVGMRVKVAWAEERTGSLQDMQYFIPE
ncbi:MAG: hypothetical protein A2W01_07115 [Candidatus Solincola sediminis]|nr:MAG: hypothetical protein A2W01_07115 [Candidatus Solincola sediminis]